MSAFLFPCNCYYNSNKNVLIVVRTQLVRTTFFKTIDRINNEKIISYVKYLLLSAFFASEFLLKMDQSAFEFFTSRYVHQRIVDYVDDKQVVNVRIDAVHSRAIHLEANAPVNNNAVHCDGKSTEPERKYIDGHA